MKLSNSYLLILLDLFTFYINQDMDNLWTSSGCMMISFCTLLSKYFIRGSIQSCLKPSFKWSFNSMLSNSENEFT